MAASCPWVSSGVIGPDSRRPCDTFCPSHFSRPYLTAVGLTPSSFLPWAAARHRLLGTPWLLDAPFVRVRLALRPWLSPAARPAFSPSPDSKAIDRAVEVFVARCPSRGPTTFGKAAVGSAAPDRRLNILPSVTAPDQRPNRKSAVNLRQRFNRPRRRAR